MRGRTHRCSGRRHHRHQDTAAAATVENLLTGAAVLVSGEPYRTSPTSSTAPGRRLGDGGKNFRQLVGHTNELLATMDRRTDQIAGSLDALQPLQAHRRQERRHRTVTGGHCSRHRHPGGADQPDHRSGGQTSSTTEMLRKFPSLAGTDTSGRSVIADLNTISGRSTTSCSTPTPACRR